MITDPAAIKFSNEQVRRTADQLGRLYYRAKQAIDLWNANNYATLFPNDATMLQDASPQDGRNQITGADANAIMTIAGVFVAACESGSNAQLNQILQVAVNPN